ncbi:MAG: preprotein translocase subunit SecE [Atopobiaceae bacterium]|nr:preprotein translocase subunit SecE [Atopobiaceae bacterium]
MPNKDRNKRSSRQARQRERAEREALVAESTANTSAKKAAAKDSKKTPVKVSTSNPTGLVGRTKKYLSDVRAEMRRVTWPSKTELTNYSVAVTAMLIVFGVAVWLVDTGVVAALVGFTNLRG